MHEKMEVAAQITSSAAVSACQSTSRTVHCANAYSSNWQPVATQPTRPKLCWTVKKWKMLQSNMNSKANGALMRITPLAVWGHQLSEGQLAQAAREDAKLTHPNQTCQVGVGTQPRQLPVHICKSIIKFLSFRCSPRSGTLMLTAACRIPKPIISQSCAYLYLSNPCMVDAQQSP